MSDLIKSGQLRRDEALLLLSKPIYDEALLRQDIEFVLKKFNLTEVEFNQIMNLPIKTFMNYPNNFKLVMLLKEFVNRLREKGLYTK